MTDSPTKKKVARLLAYLDRKFKGRAIELDYSTPLELLVATILSAQCTDERVNRVTPALFAKYRTVRDFANADLTDLQEMIRPTGFYKAKGRSIVQCCRRLLERHDGEIPDTMQELVQLPGIWRKTANVILGNVFGKPSIVVDTHVKRVSQRLGLTGSEDPDEIEADLAKVLPRARWTEASHQILLHGRYVCKAKTPLCLDCGVYEICSWKQKARRGAGVSRKRPGRAGKPTAIKAAPRVTTR